MAPRFLSGASWDQSPGIGLPLVAVIALVTMLVGGMIGFLLGGNGNRSAGPAVSLLAGTTFDDLNNGDSSEQGAVRAATTYISAMPDVSILPEANRRQAVDRVIASGASNETRQAVLASLGSLGRELKPTATASSARVVTLPGVYKSGPLQGGYAVTVWYCVMIADSSRAKFMSVWQTADIALEYENGWRITQFRNNFGPSPALFSPQGQSGDFSAAQPLLNESFAFRHGPVPRS